MKSGWILATIPLVKRLDRAYPLAQHQEYALSMTGKIGQVEVITSVQRRRRWTTEEKVAIVQETYAPGMLVSLVARRQFPCGEYRRG
jgi:hypothetical protein